MAINFPDNPTVGQTFTAANRTWTFNGSSWVGDYSSTGNADTIDGIDSSQFLRSDTSDTMNGTLTLNGTLYKNDTVNNVGYSLATDSVGGGRAYFILDSDSSDGVGAGSDYVYIGTDSSTFRGNLTVGSAGAAGNLYVPAGSVGIGTNNPTSTLDVRGTGAIKVPVGTTAQRPTATTGQLRFNSEAGSFEGYNGSAWGSIGGGGATGGGSDQVFVENDQTVTANYTIPANKNAMTTGPININGGVVVTISSGARWVII